VHPVACDGILVWPVYQEPQTSPHSLGLNLLDGFGLVCDGETVHLPSSSQRVLAFLALRGRRTSRARVAYTLWADAGDARALASLRSALWRLRQAGHPVVITTDDALGLAPGVRVDLYEGLRLAAGILDGSSEATPSTAASGLVGELLPDWYDEWVLVERERFNELRVHALEMLCERNLHVGRTAHAIDAGLAAVRAEPLRESTHRALISAYLAEGNHAEALAHYRSFAQRLRDQVGLRPSAHMDALLAGVISD
jgi:DNA-binding SARP family transcriptional activator